MGRHDEAPPANPELLARLVQSHPTLAPQTPQGASGNVKEEAVEPAAGAAAGGLPPPLLPPSPQEPTTSGPAMEPATTDHGGKEGLTAWAALHPAFLVRNSQALFRVQIITCPAALR